jgi:hypothetical protein
MPSRSFLVVLCMISSLLGTACTRSTDNHPTTTTWEGTKVLLTPDCPLTPQREEESTESLTAILIPVVTALAPTVIDKTLDILVDYLKKQKEAYTAIGPAKTAGKFYVTHGNEVVSPRYGCLVVVRGVFGVHVEKAGSTSQASELWTHENLQKVKLASRPALYAEFQIDYLGRTEPTHMVLQPVFLDYRETAARKTGRSGKKDLLFVFEFKTSQPTWATPQLSNQSNGPSKTQDSEGIAKEDVITVFSVEMKEVRIGTRVTQEALSSITSNVQVLPVTARTNVQKDGSMNIVPFTAPFQVALILTETEDGGAFFLQASEALSASKASLSKETVRLIEKVLDGTNKTGKD